MEAFESPRKLVRKGLHIGGTKYEVTNVEEEHVINGNKVILLLSQFSIKYNRISHSFIVETLLFCTEVNKGLFNKVR